ncbi:MAG: exonuclease domain-containing protein [Candidatus Ornithomonoglobus sp.]
MSVRRITKRNKGVSLLTLPDNYIVIDIETTGLCPEYDSIIELSALKISDNKITDKFSSLVKPNEVFIDDDYNELYVDGFITELTGITNDMLENAPKFPDIAKPFLSFIGDSIIVGHNVNFDINFLYDNILECMGIEFHNDFCDLLRISRRLFPDLQNHKLNTLAMEFNIKQPTAHRGLADCETTFSCFEYCKSYSVTNNTHLDYTTKSNIDLRKIQTTKMAFNEEHPLYKKHCVFTGALEKMKRSEAAQVVVDFGGICENNVTKKTNYLILGNNDYCKSIKGGKSNKQKKAELLILSGQDLCIIPESLFYDMISENTGIGEQYEK